MGGRSTHSAWWLLAIIDLPESWYRASVWRRWGYCMATMLPNIALFAETGQRGTLNPLCVVAASEYKATRELVEDSWMATMGCCMATILRNA
jgi:hypothetical protein